MAILRVARMGHPMLRQVAAPVTPEELADDEVQVLIDDMMDTVADYDGAGLAAPQVHEGLRIVVVTPPGGDEEDDDADRPALVLVNPEVVLHGAPDAVDWEGCLSIPEIRGRVPRHRALDLMALDRDGGKLELRAEGYLARIIQHEVDHLDGVLFLDRMRDMQSLCFLSEYARYANESA